MLRSHEPQHPRRHDLKKKKENFINQNVSRDILVGQIPRLITWLAWVRAPLPQLLTLAKSSAFAEALLILHFAVNMP